MRVLVTWGSKLGGTEGIARSIGDVLERAGFEVALVPAGEVIDVAAYDAAIIGGALYANRWHRAARKLVTRNVAALRRMPVWMFSSGPLDHSADAGEIPPTRQVGVLMERVGACGHVTFGGRLPADATGFPARAMAREHAGDWRNQNQIRSWAESVARVLPDARPGFAVEHPARSVPRLVAHGVAGWAGCAVAMALLLWVASDTVAIVVHAIAAPVIFAALAVHYFHARGARDPLPTAGAFTVIVVVLDALIVAGLVQGNASVFTSIAGMWLPVGLIFLATWLTGLLVSVVPPPEQRHAT